ncbi:EAL domain-containing protein (putative c-di-GMP-specific phosphodiesterase class I) [Ilumatobacter fluminis]|uniref:EAL domain-containing protein (Putative c-di-GMP-specific phosphodiesterase class I) n=1 Tax=Ilumatobacter fluminis TaxID=467091 RepID=A0A4V3EIX0_9ACTN|nr:EAL domain-containing response regulator [Ilumatobacter fluminis]TDT16028.1 EAL domain-containing protein (putative c-di-GMP-specific phosphodiesterase class I) [Ilumatobacter fluminis]
MINETSNERRPVIVIADDSAVHRVAMTAMLERAGFDVHAGHDGAEAVSLVSEVRPDALVVDALMPRMSGFQVIEHIRRSPMFAALPTIVVSGLEDVASRVRALSIGADDFVCKPVHADELVARLRAHLRQNRVAAHRVAAERDDWYRDTIAHRRFTMHYQPIVDMTCGEVEATEALVRFDDGTSPVDVFHTPDHHDRRVELELEIVAAVTDDLASGAVSVPVHVNVSPAAALDPRLGELVHGTGRPLVLEITENAAFDAHDAATLRAQMPPTCRLAADDVGAGYAGLVQLVGVQPDLIKIDREIVSSIDTDPARQVVVSGLIEFAATTGAELVAEGIETAAEAAFLIEIGVRLGQGYFFGRPAPLAAGTVLDPDLDTDDIGPVTAA